MSKKLTDWFPPEVKPVNIGVYETRKKQTYQHWNGVFWGEYMPSAYCADLVKGHKSMCQRVAWRGLAEKP